MCTIRFFFYLLSGCLITLGQEPVEKELLNSPRTSTLQYDAFSYADLGTGEKHSYFSVLYQLNPKLEAELRVFYDTYQISNRVRAEFLLKKYVTDKLYIFSGLEIEAETKVMPGRSILPPRLGAIGGVGYDVNDNFLLEAKGNFQLNNSPLGVFGERLVKMPEVYTVGGKVRF